MNIVNMQNNNIGVLFDLDGVIQRVFIPNFGIKLKENSRPA